MEQEIIETTYTVEELDKMMLASTVQILDYNSVPLNTSVNLTIHKIIPEETEWGTRYDIYGYLDNGAKAKTSSWSILLGKHLASNILTKKVSLINLNGKKLKLELTNE